MKDLSEARRIVEQQRGEIERLQQEVTMLRQEYAADTAEIANLNAMLDEHRGVIWASYFYTRQSATGAFRDAKF